MQKRIVVGCMAAASIGLAALSIWYLKAQHADIASVRAGGAISLTENQKQASVPIDTASPTPRPSTGLTVKDASGAGQLTSGNTSNTSSSNSSSLPGPDSFGQYDQYKDNTASLFGEVRAGDGAVAEAGKTVTVNYKGWLTNGTLFDDSYQRGKPYAFTIGEHRVILGWEEAIIGMKVGGKRRFIIPPSVGYGTQEQNGIPGNSVLVFDVELLEVK